VYRPQLTRPYTDDQLEGMLTDALRVLETIGVECNEPGAVERVTAEAGVTHDGGRLKFDPDAMRAHIAEVRERIAATEDVEPPFEALTAWCCLNYADPETHEVRPPTTEDAIRMTRLMDARGCSNWSIPLVPADVNPRHRTLACEYIALANSRGLGGFTPATDKREIEYLIDMYQAAGRTFLLDEQIGISPLRFNDEGLAAALHFAWRDDVNVILVGPIPSVGSTTPFSIRSAVVQSVAESLALSLTTVRLGLGEGGFSAGLQSFDFQYLTMPYGSAEATLYTALTARMTEHLTGRTPRTGGFRSMARMPDAQAAAERTAYVLWQALLGCRRFRGVGQLAIDEIFSPEQVIIDDAILAHVERIVRGLDPMASGGDVVDEIAAGLAAGGFIAEEATVANFRDQMLFPDLFCHYNVGHWRSIGAPTVCADAWARARQQLATWDFQLPTDRRKELDRIYNEAIRTIR